MTSVERLLTAALAPVLGVPVVAEVPDPRPARFVRVVAAGGPPVTALVLDRAEVAWEAWATRRRDADDLALALRDAITDLAGTEHVGAFVLDASCGRGRWFPDVSGVARFVGTASLLINDN